jgi:hypothetical protein
MTRERGGSPIERGKVSPDGLDRRKSGDYAVQTREPATGGGKTRAQGAKGTKNNSEGRRIRRKATEKSAGGQMA